MPRPLRIALVAGEESGDILGAGLMSALMASQNQMEFIGVGGKRMQALGLNSLYPMDRLSVMGLWEPLKRLPELLGLRKKLIKEFAKQKVDLFVGIDAPDFNLGIAHKLHRRGIKTAHYVSPSVWAWRQGRVKTMRKSLDMMLTLLPFEASFYEKHRVPVTFVGHPLASQIQSQPHKDQARERLGISCSGPLVALLPGSRSSEVKHLLPVYLQVAEILSHKISGIRFAIAAANQRREDQIREIAKQSSIPVYSEQTLDLIEASDIVLAASGTTTLEVMLVNRPMVITYKTDTLSWHLISRMLRVKWVGLPNLIAAEELVLELLQDQATAGRMAQKLADLLQNADTRQALSERFEQLGDSIRLPSNERAASALLNLLELPFASS